MSNKYEDFLIQLQVADESNREWLVMEFSLQNLTETLQQVIWAAAIPHWFDKGFLNAILETSLAKADFNALTELSFIETFSERGFNIHEHSRKLLLKQLWKNNKHQFVKLTQNAALFYQQQDQNDNLLFAETIYHQILAGIKSSEYFSNILKILWNDFEYERLEILLSYIIDAIDMGFIDGEIAGWTYCKQGDLDILYGQFFSAKQNILTATRYLDNKDKNVNKELKANCTKNLGEVAYWLCEDSEAEEHYQAALSLYREIGDKSGEASCIKFTGDIVLIKLWKEGCQEAQERYQDALSSFIVEKNKVGEVNCLNALGRISYILANYQEASEYYQRSLTLCEKIGDKKSQTVSIQGLGEIALTQERYLDAEYHYQMALNINNEIGAKVGVAKCFEGLGHIKFWLDNEQKSVQLYQKAREFWHDAGVKLNEALMYKNLGKANFWLNNYKVSINFYQEAYKLYETLNNKPETENCSQKIAEIILIQEESLSISKEKKFIAKRGHLVHKLKAKDSTGRWAYYFVLVKPEKEKKFLVELKSDKTIDLEDYGQVIASCYGEEPNEKVQKELKEKYSFFV